MAAEDLLSLAPLMAMAAAAVLVLLLVAVRRSHAGAAAIACLGFAGALAALPWVAPGPGISRRLTPLFTLDRFGVFYLGVIAGASLLVTLLARGYLRGRRGDHEEFYALLLLGGLGAGALVVSSHFASLFLALEVLSVSIYAMAAHLRASGPGLEAALKYLVLASTSAAFLLFGAALIYAETGTMEFGGALRPRPGEGDAVLLLGAAMAVVGIGFKLAVAPFHLWTPDVYQGAPPPTAAFVAAVSKGAMLAVLLRFSTATGALDRPSLFLALALMAVLSMIAGNLLALLSDSVKRLLAYSSIAHMGYLLVPVLAGGRMGAEAAALYLVAYIAAVLAAFGVVGALSGPERDADSFADYRGLFWRRPALAGVLTASLLSLAGIPVTAGFVGKLTLVAAGVGGARWALVMAVLATSVVGLFYYLRLVIALYLPEERAPAPARGAFSFAGSLALLALGAILLGVGIYPAPLLDLILAAAVPR